MVSIGTAARDLGRLRKITTVLARHGFGEVVSRLGIARGRSERPPDSGGTREADLAGMAVRIRRVLEELGPSFVKLGQIVSTRGDLLPADLLAELKKLQDAVPPVPFAEIRECVESALGAPLEEVYEQFTETPLAAASIAQVHRATLRTAEGTQDVVVKVQRPGIAETVASDLDLLHSFAALLERAMPETKIYSPIKLVEQFDHAITSELDFTAEAENARRFAANSEGTPCLFPRVFREASTRRVITLEYLDGKKIEVAIAQGYDAKRLAQIGLEAIVKQIFEDGFFHADPHPGNVLVLGEPFAPVFGLVDLGMVGRLSPRMRDRVVDLMVAASRQDHDGIADALYAIGTPTKKIDREAFRAEVSFLADRYLGKKLKDIELSAVIRDLVRAATKYGIEVPPDFLLVGKALMTIEGIGREIYPDLDVFEESKPYFLNILRKRYSPEKVGNELLRRLERLSGATADVPFQLQEVLNDLRLGRLAIRTDSPTGYLATERLSRRLFTALVFSSLLLGSSWLITSGFDTLGATLLGLALAILVGHAAASVHDRYRK